MVTRDQIVAALKASKRSLADCIVIQRSIIRADGMVVAMHRRMIRLKKPKKKER